ncbi:MAG: hypothetical protein M3R61_00045 [Chloroflexota bacterium]|nr:hypothetical protein [Chloroflexota bacterium]
MTTQQYITIQHIEAQHEAQRAAAQLNSRPVLTLKARAINLYDAMMVAKAAGDLDKARALAAELTPLLSYLD